MRESFKKIIRNIIINEYYQAPDQNQIIAILKKGHSDKIFGLSDYELNNIIVEASQDIDFKFLSFFKKIHEDYFFTWFENNKINRKDLKEIFEKATTQSIDTERLAKDIFEILNDKNFNPENNSVIPDTPDAKFLVSINWIIQEESVPTDLDNNLNATPEIENLPINNSELYTTLEEKIKNSFEKNNILGGRLLSLIFAQLEGISNNSDINVKVVTDLFKKYEFTNYPDPQSDKEFTNKETVLSVNWYKLGSLRKINPPPVKESTTNFSSLRKKIIGATFLMLAAIGIAGYFIWYKPYIKDKNAARMYSYANSLTLRSSPAAGGDYNAIGNILYGTEILVYSYNGDWAECKANGRKGYVALLFLLSKKDFHELNGILADPDTRDEIASTKCRRALLNYFNSKGIMGKIDSEIQKEIYGEVKQKEVWQVFTKPSHNEPNNAAYPKVVNPKSRYTDFACIIKNITTNKRKFLLFSFSDDEKETLESEQDAPDVGYIQSVSRYPYKVRYAN